MENTPTPNADFENYLRKNLQQINATPDEDVWANIAAKQALPNKWLKIRSKALYVAGAALIVVASIATWQQQNRSSKTPENETLEQQVPFSETLPMAKITEAEHSLETESPKSAKSHAVVPNYSPRVNSVPAASIRFTAENGLKYQSPLTGTSISIPANSLVNQYGKPVQGEVELFFREYRTIEEFLASGIPMHYSDPRGSYAFNSGGMFEVRVSQAGEALAMAGGQKYDVAFSATTELEKASLYYLDDKTGEWRFVPDAAFGQANLQEPPVTTEAVAISNNLKQKNSKCRPPLGEIVGDPSHAEMVKLGVQTGFDLATNKLTMPTWFKKNPTLTDNQLLFRMERGLIQIKKHKDHSQLFFPEDLNKFFSELAAFKGCFFTYDLDSLGGTKKGKHLTDSDYWQRITVIQEKGANCIITLFDGKEGQMQFHATLTGSTENKTFNPDKVMAEYVRLRQLRQQDFARKNQALRYFHYASDAFKTEEEWCYTVIQWLEYFEKNHPLMARRYAALIKEGLNTDDDLATAAWKKWLKTLRDFRFDNLEGQNASFQSKNNMTYALSVSNFGVYNCDQIFRLSREYIFAEYRTANGTQIIPSFVSVMEGRTKLFFTLPSAAKLLYCPNREIDVIVTDREGRQYHYPSKKYAAREFDKYGANVLTLNDVTDQTQSARAWAELLEI